MKKILTMFLLGFITTSYGDMDINWSAGAGFYFNYSANPPGGILGDGTGNSTSALLIYVDGYGGEAVLDVITITEDGILGNGDEVACFARHYRGPFSSGYVYAKIYKNNHSGGGYVYYATPPLALTDITGNALPQNLEMNTDLINGNSMDFGETNVHAYLGPRSWLRTGSAGANGTVSPTSTTVYESDNVDFVITADSYYRIASLTINGTAVTGMVFDNNSTFTNFTWGGLQDDGTLAATFTAQVTTNAPANVPYEWMAGYGLTNYNTDATNDVDLDRLAVWQEYIAGTDPANPVSSLCVTEEPLNVLGWNAVSGRVYSIYWTTNLMNGFQCLESNIPWTQVSFTNSTDVPCGYYKIDVRLEN